MKAQLFGIQKVDFKPADGDAIKGVKLHFFTAPSDSMIENFNGFTYEKQWVGKDSKAKLFGFTASDLFDKFNEFKGELKFPLDVEITYELNGRKAEFASIDILTK